ncbi:MAG: hypothetical protein WDN49_07340 [Acetobacteraceae bacterium]
MTAGAQTLAVRAGLAALLFAAWELAPRAGLVDSELLPPLSQVLGALGTLLGRAAIRTDLLATAAEMAVAFVISVPPARCSAWCWAKAPASRAFSTRWSSSCSASPNRSSCRCSSSPSASASGKRSRSACSPPC